MDNKEKEHIKSEILRRRKQIMVHSCLYYRMSTNIISDFVYDQIGRRLANLQLEYPELSKEVDYYYEYFCMYTSECTSGYNLPIANQDVVGTAEYILKVHNKFITEHTY